MSSSDNNQEMEFDVRYAQPAALYTSQFLLHAGGEEITLDCTSGIDGQSDGSKVVPVHTRLALSWGAAQRLSTLLQQALEQRAKTTSVVPTPHIRTDAAKLPSFDGATL